jgi:hypothetical protein
MFVQAKSVSNYKEVSKKKERAEDHELWEALCHRVKVCPTDPYALDRLIRMSEFDDPRRCDITVVYMNDEEHGNEKEHDSVDCFINDVQNKLQFIGFKVGIVDIGRPNAMRCLQEAGDAVLLVISTRHVHSQFEFCSQNLNEFVNGDATSQFQFFTVYKGIPIDSKPEWCLKYSKNAIREWEATNLDAMFVYMQG